MDASRRVRAAVSRWPLRVDWTIAVLVAALIIGGALRADRAVHPGRFVAADERAYTRLASSLTRGDFGERGLRHPFHWGPGTPAAFALARDVSALLGINDAPGQPRSTYWLQVVVGLAMIGAAYGLAKELAGRAAGAVAASATALYPPLIAATGEAVSEPLGALTLTVALWLVCRAWRRSSPVRWAAAGAGIGAAILVRADLLVIPVVVAAFVFAVLPTTRAHRLRALGAFAGGVAVLVGPWVLYASMATGSFVPVTDAGSSTLFVATYLPGGGTMFGLKKTPLADHARAAHPAAARGPDSALRAEWILDDVARPGPGETRDHELRQDALDNLRRYALGDPIGFGAMSVSKLKRMWLDYDRGTTHGQRPWILALHLALVGAALAGLCLGLLRRRDRRLGIVLLVLSTATLVNAFFVAEPRANLRLLPALFAAGAAGLARLDLMRSADS